MLTANLLVYSPPTIEALETVEEAGSIIYSRILLVSRTNKGHRWQTIVLNYFEKIYLEID